MQIYGPAHLHATQPVHAPHAPASARPAAELQTAGAIQDEVQISDAGQFVDQARQLPDIRADRVREIRDALASGTYDVDSRLDLALSRLLDEIA
jgi:flagellar biosynthesis anti-sigma factor FlgM